MLKLILSALIAFTATPFLANAQTAIEESMQADIEKGNKSLIANSSAQANIDELKVILKRVEEIIVQKRADQDAIKNSLRYSNSEQQKALIRNLRAVNQNISTLEEIKHELKKTIVILEREQK